MHNATEANDVVIWDLVHHPYNVIIIFNDVLEFTYFFNIGLKRKFLEDIYT